MCSPRLPGALVVDFRGEKCFSRQWVVPVRPGAPNPVVFSGGLPVARRLAALFVENRRLTPSGSSTALRAPLSPLTEKYGTAMASPTLYAVPVKLQSAVWAPMLETPVSCAQHEVVWPGAVSGEIPVRAKPRRNTTFLYIDVSSPQVGCFHGSTTPQ